MDALTEAIDRVTTMDIVDAFNIPFRIRNGKILLLCPGHDDKNFGSCYVDRNDNGYYCYACGEHVSKFRMVEKLTGSSKSAADWFFSVTGVQRGKPSSPDRMQILVKKASAALNIESCYLRELSAHPEALRQILLTESKKKRNRLQEISQKASGQDLLFLGGTMLQADEILEVCHEKLAAIEEIIQQLEAS